MKPGKYDLAIYRGDTYAWQFAMWQDAASTVPLNLTGVIPAAEIRNASAGRVYVTFTPTITQPNIVLLKLSAVDSAKCPATGVWDLQLTFPNGDVNTVIAGTVTVTADVTDSVVAPAPQQVVAVAQYR
jgi:hypothetical protein